ncbi:hypothetical protein EV426DRAFT_27837 [Tirmania nivea]|nr:hypothetical protein EV426DRAFT_27837 [Tirmania nivea]
MKSTNCRIGLSMFITTILLLAFLSRETSLRVDAKRVFRPVGQDAAKLELAQSIAAHQLSKTTPSAFIAGNTKELGKRDGLVEKRDEEVGFHPPRTPHASPGLYIKRGGSSSKPYDDDSVGKSAMPKTNASLYGKIVWTSQSDCSTTSICTTVNCAIHRCLH